MSGYGNTGFNPSGGFNTASPSAKSTTSFVNNAFMPACGENSGDKDRFQGYWTDYTKNYGVRIDYWKNAYSTKTHDFLYGEDPTAGFGKPRTLKAAFELSSSTNILNKFGIMGENDGELYISREEWESVWGTELFPTMKDVFRVTDWACKRPEGQGSWVFQLADKYDHANPVDFLGGYYVWRMPVKRFKFSYEPNAPDEKSGESDDTSDSDIFGRLTEPKTGERSYPEKIDEEAKKDLKTDDGNQYGGYL